MTGIDVVTIIIIMTTTEAIVASSGVKNIMNHLSNNKTIIHHNQDDMINLHRHGRLKHHSQYNEVGKMMWKIGLHPYVPCVNSKVTLLDK